MSEDLVDQPPPPPPPSGEDWQARIEQLLTEAEAAPSLRSTSGGWAIRTARW
jgi:hypothetical protein